MFYLLLLWRTEGEKAYNIGILIHAHHCRKKVGSGGYTIQTGHPIDKILYQPFPWKLAEQGQRLPCIYLHLPISCTYGDNESAREMNATMLDIYIPLLKKLYNV